MKTNSDNELLIDLLQEVNKTLLEQIKLVLEEHDIMPTTMLIAVKLFRNPGVTVSELSRISKVTKSHVSTTIEQLSKRGWVEKRLDPADQRIVQLYLTEDAVINLGNIRSDVRDYMAGIVSRLSTKRIEELISGLRDLKTSLEEEKKNK